MNPSHPSVVLEGSLSVRAALSGGCRTVYQILFDRLKAQKSRDIQAVLRLAQGRNVPIVPASQEALSAIASGRTFGGLVALASGRSYLAAPELLATRGRLYAALEGFEDPYNYGYALRTLYAAGFDGVFTARASWGPTEGTLVKASAGASEALPTALIDDYGVLLGALHSFGCTLVCAARGPSSQSLYGAAINLPALVAIGGERRGISRALLRAADLTVSLPYARPCPFDLPGVCATAAIAFELHRRAGEPAPLPSQSEDRPG